MSRASEAVSRILEEWVSAQMLSSLTVKSVHAAGQVHGGFGAAHSVRCSWNDSLRFLSYIHVVYCVEERVSETVLTMHLFIVHHHCHLLYYENVYLFKSFLKRNEMPTDAVGMCVLMGHCLPASAAV